MTRALVTGSAGFIGGHLVNLLTSRGYDVLGIDRREPFRAHNAPFELVDLLDASSLKACLERSRPKVVFHLAARTDISPGTDVGEYGANIQGVSNLLEAMRSAGSVERAICTSSQLVCPIGYVPENELDVRPTTSYGASKVLTERLWRDADGAGTVWTIVRPTTIWGPYMNPGYLRFFGMLRRGTYFHVGRRPLYKSYGYVGNIVHEYERLAAAPAEQVNRRTFYLADYEPIALQGWVDEFGRALGAPRVRTMPRWVARLGASVGDLAVRAGRRSFPFTSYRLNNVMTQYRFDLSEVESIVGPLPYRTQEGVTATANWLRSEAPEAA